MPDTNDFWPANIADSNLITPVTILKEQAALLGEKTRQLVKGEVVTQTTGNLFVHCFYIAAPTLSYKFELFTLSHGVNFYPLVMRYLNDTISLRSESEFKDKLKEIFVAPHTLNVVHSILAQVRS
ncbi:MAG TPA: hypothetical protein VFC29_22350 [Candidatus Limnocylindrales bacterium]|nr:hypothetical protein [Candidatus Limnocylindrales bacterium]